MSELENIIRRMFCPALVLPLALYLFSCGAAAQPSGQGTGKGSGSGFPSGPSSGQGVTGNGVAVAGMSNAQLDNLGCPVLPNRTGTGTLIWEYDPTKWPDANYSKKKIQDPTLRTSLRQAGWTGHWAISTAASSCGSLEVSDDRGTSLLWKEITVGPGKVFRITVQIWNVRQGAFMGLENGQVVIYGCSATLSNLTQVVEISRMSATPWDATMGPPRRSKRWMTMVALVRTTHVQANDKIAIALTTGGKAAARYSLVRVEEVNPSVCTSQNCSDMKDCSDFTGIAAKWPDKVDTYKPASADTCLVNHSGRALPVAQHSRPVMYLGRQYNIVFGSMDTDDVLSFNTILIAQIILNEVIGAGTIWRQNKIGESELVARVAGFNITSRKGPGQIDNLTKALATTPMIDLSIDTPLDWVGMPINPADFSEGMAALPKHAKANIVDLGSAGLSSYEALFITVPAVAKALQNGVVLDSWATLSRNFTQNSPPVYSYFNEPESWASQGGWEYSPDMKCSSTTPMKLRLHLVNRGYKCWAEAWWASPSSESYTAVSKGKATTKYRCIPFVINAWKYSDQKLTDIFDVVYNTGMKVCVTELIANIGQLLDKGENFVTWLSFPGVADPNDVNIIDLPAQYVPIRMPYKKVIWNQLESINRQTFEFLTDFAIPTADMTQIIQNVRLARQQDPSKSDFVVNYAEACKWVRNHEALWQDWLQVKCSKGFVSAQVNGFINCVRCPAGKFNAFIGVGTTCKNCSVGYYSSSDGASQCEECKTGHYRDYEGSEQCARCVRGMYSDVAGATACKSCQDVLPSSTTQLLGAQNASDCSCERTHFNPRDYEAGSSSGCQPCPEGIICPGFAVLGQTPPERLEKGYYASPFNPINKVWQCVSEKACPGTEDQANNDHPCGNKRTGLNCGLCIGNHYAVGQGAHCLECQRSAIILPIALVLYFLFSGVFHYLWNERAAYVEATESVLASVTMGVTLAFLQTLGIFDNLHFAWPEEFQSLLGFARLFIFDLQFLRPSCVFEQTLPTAYLGRLLVPAVLTGIFLMWYFASHLLHLVSRFPIFAMRGILNSVGMIVQSVYISLVTSSVSLMECYSSPNGKYAIRGYPYAQCFTTEHLSLIPAMVIAFIGYVIGVFVLFTWLCHVAPRKQGSVFFRHATRFLVFKFHPTKWWYGLVLMVRSLALALVTVVEPSDGYTQFIMMLFILIASVIVHLDCLPYSDWYANMLENVELSLLIAILGIGSWFIEERDYDGKDRTKAIVLSILMCSCVVVCVLVLVATFIYAVWIAKYPQKKRATDKKEVENMLKKFMPCVTHLATAEEKEVENMLLTCTYLDRVCCRKFMNFALLEFSGMQSDKFTEQRLSRKRASFVQKKVTTLSDSKLHKLKRTVSEEFVKKQLDSQPVKSWSVGRSANLLDDQPTRSSRISFEDNRTENVTYNPLRTEEDLNNAQFRQGDDAEAVAVRSIDATSAASLLGTSLCQSVTSIPSVSSTTTCGI